MHLEVRHLRLVAEIAALGTMTRAATQLHLTQSALSHQLRDIEDRLGTPLFLRVGKRLVLTPAGDRVLQSAERVIEELARVEDDVQRLAANRDGVIRVCTQCNTGYHWLPPLLREFHAAHPGVDVRIAVEATMQPLQRLLEGRLDVAIMTEPVHDPRVRRRVLFEDEIVALVAPSHRLARRRFIEVRDLAPEHLLVYAGSRDDSFTVRRILEPAGVVPAKLSFVQLTEAIVEMARAGIGVGMIPRWSVEPLVAAGQLRGLRVTAAGVYREWAAMTLAASEEPRYLTDFLDLLARRSLPARVRTGSRRRRKTALPLAEASDRAVHERPSLK
jgi:LysR family transcriptional regulator, regulator for metE and metH